MSTSLLEDYRDLRHRPSARRNDRQAFFLVEGPRVIRRLIASGYQVRSIIVEHGRDQRVLGTLPKETPLLTLSRDEIRSLSGFDFHRGYLASADRRPFQDLAQLDPARLILGFIGVTDMENLGSLLRSAAAFGIRQVLLDSSTADPYSRRVSRVSMGASLAMEYYQLNQPSRDLRALHERGVWSLAATPAVDAESVADLPPTESSRLLLMGNESDGLPKQVLANVSQKVRIPMPGRGQESEVVDSLNVAVAGAILMHELS
ncbi:MAG: RNA methyltransferase [Planctomycetota bacterium]